MPGSSGASPPGGSRPTDLAEQARITERSAGFPVDQLQERGHVERVPDPTGACARLVRIAGRGERVLPVAAAAVAEVEAAWTADLGERSIRDLRSAPGRLREITDPYA